MTRAPEERNVAREEVPQERYAPPELRKLYGAQLLKTFRPSGTHECLVTAIW